MAETVGSLVDKLTIVKLKQWHCDTVSKQESLALQESALVAELDSLIGEAVSKSVHVNALKFSANKVYKKEGNSLRTFGGGFAASVSNLAKVNCELWHEQEKVYDFEAVPLAEKNLVVSNIATLNLERNKLIEQIDDELIQLLKESED